VGTGFKQTQQTQKKKKKKKPPKKKKKPTRAKDGLECNGVSKQHGKRGPHTNKNGLAVGKHHAHETPVQKKTRGAKRGGKVYFIDPGGDADEIVETSGGGGGVIVTKERNGNSETLSKTR